jgi:hypothetical protein
MSNGPQTSIELVGIYDSGDDSLIVQVKIGDAVITFDANNAELVGLGLIQAANSARSQRITHHAAVSLGLDTDALRRAISERRLTGPLENPLLDGAAKGPGIEKPDPPIIVLPPRGRPS